MSKVLDADDTGVPQNQRDFNDDVRRITNFGKYQVAVVASPPTWTGRRGEFVLVIGSTGTFMVCTTDNSTTWRAFSTFTL